MLYNYGLSEIKLYMNSQHALQWNYTFDIIHFSYMNYTFDIFRFSFMIHSQENRLQN